MGSASSKTARKLPRTPTGVRTGPSSRVAEGPHPHARPTIKASETKTDEITRDSQDPQFLANLSKLGAVRVDHHMQTIRPGAASAQHLFQSRLRSEDEARSSRPTHNRLVAHSLMELLEERKYAKTPEQLEDIARKYNIDAAKVESLARYVNSVTVDQATVKRWVDEEGTENVTMEATWINPRLERPAIGPSH